MKKTLLLGLLILLVAPPLAAQTGLQRAKAALPRETARQFEQTVLAARKRGLPTEPLIDKALEGVAKKVPPSVIMNAVRHKVELMTRADAALRPFGPPTAADVTATADVIQRGVSQDVIKQVRAGKRQGEPVGLSLHTVADLLDRRVPAKVAIDVIASWRERGGRNEELRSIPLEVDKLIRLGASPSSAGRSIAASVRQGRPPSPAGAANKPTSSRGSSAGPGSKPPEPRTREGRH
ncbi:MAG TPA: hypothetical protein VGC44_03540 [Longimicrobiales bacterium]